MPHGPGSVRRFVRTSQCASQRAQRAARELSAIGRQCQHNPTAVDVSAFVEREAPLLRRTLSRRQRLSLDLEAVLPLADFPPETLRDVLLQLCALAKVSLGGDGGNVHISTGRLGTRLLPCIRISLEGGGWDALERPSAQASTLSLELARLSAQLSPRGARIELDGYPDPRSRVTLSLPIITH